MYQKICKRINKYLAGVLVLIGVLMLGGCNETGTKVVFTTGFGKDEIFRIGGESCRVNELMVYLTNAQNQYEQVYGEGIWNAGVDGVTLEENVKETVLAQVAQIKTMYLLAEEKGVTLDEAEEGAISRAAEEYFSSLGETEIEKMEVTQETIEELYREYALADKVYRDIIQDVNPEISDDEARTITVQHILLRTYTTDSKGEKIPYTETLKAAAYDKITQVRELAVEGEHDFAELAGKYSEDSNVTYSFGKGEMDEAFETAAFNLGTDEISAVVESDAGYHIIKCLNTFNKEETDVNKQEIVEQRRREVFGQEYDRFVASLVRNLNQKRFDEVSLIRDSQVDTADFFAVYDKYFAE